MSLFLFDINFIVAFLQPNHDHHEAAHAWFLNREKSRWATCQLSINGAFRVFWRLTAFSRPMLASDIAETMQIFLDKPGRVTLNGHPQITDLTVFDLTKLRGHNQIPDVILLAIAVQNQARLLTFDQSIPWAAVKGATEKDIRLLAP